MDVRSHRVEEFRKGGGTSIRLGLLDIAGTLAVTDADKLVQTLMNGVGPAKAFGCGLLLVRRV